MRQLFIAIIAALALSGCKTSGYNPLKVEAGENSHQSRRTLTVSASTAALPACRWFRL
jgi:hypothetical protein